MNYKNYSVDDFIKDEFFQDSILDPGIQSEKFWDDFVKENPQKADDLRLAKEFLLKLNFRQDDHFELKISNLKDRIDKEIDMGIRNEDPIPTIADRITRKRKPWKIIGIAASVGIIAISLLWYLRDDFVAETTTFLPGVANIRKDVTTQDNPKGKRTIISLEDGTKVWLNAESTLEYPETFANKPFREVHLVGEAFFDVQENVSQPFIVHTSDINIKVLGTSFNVKSYKEDRNIETTLVHGKVTIESSNEKTKHVTLLPNQKAIFEKESKNIVLENQVNTEISTAWKEGNLIFEGRPLHEIIGELERWYNVTILVKDKASLKCHYSAKINNKTLEEVLELFRVTDGIEYQIDGKKVTIAGTLCTE